PAALSVKVTARIWSGSNAPAATWFAIRRVIVVVLPEPAPARMQTGPRTRSTAPRCSEFRPSKIALSSTAAPYPARWTILERRLFRNCVFFRDRRTARVADHRRQPRDDLKRLVRVDEPLQLAERLLEPARVDHLPAHAQDLRMRRLLDRLGLAPEILVELLARPGADELDRNLGVGLLAREPNHLLRQLEDLDGLAHVEHEHLATTADRARLDHERDRFRDRHEEARHLRVRDGHGAALRDLAPEDRDHAARRA